MEPDVYRVTLEYDDDRVTVLDGFGPSTVVGIVKDALAGHYGPEVEPDLVSLTIEAVNFDAASSDKPPEE